MDQVGVILDEVGQIVKYLFIPLAQRDLFNWDSFLLGSLNIGLRSHSLLVKELIPA